MTVKSYWFRMYMVAKDFFKKITLLLGRTSNNVTITTTYIYHFARHIMNYYCAKSQTNRLKFRFYMIFLYFFLIQNGRHDNRKLIIKTNFNDVASPLDTDFFQCIIISVYLTVSELIDKKIFPIVTLWEIKMAAILLLLECPSKGVGIFYSRYRPISCAKSQTNRLKFRFYMIFFVFFSHSKWPLWQQEVDHQNKFQRRGIPIG